MNLKNRELQFFLINNYLLVQISLKILSKKYNLSILNIKNWKRKFKNSIRVLKLKFKNAKKK